MPSTTESVCTAQKPHVIVTGFGPFGNHKINASSEAVKHLKKEGLQNDKVQLVTLELPVEYEAVKKKIPHLWREYNPVLVVHVGVSGIATEITLEQQAHNDGYDKPDVQGKCPDTHCCVEEKDQCCLLVSGINMNQVCKRVNDAGTVKACVSDDAGRYLCDFAYFTSLNMDHCKSAFIHVPPLDAPYSAAQLASGLRVAINAMLEQSMQH
ncbi:hypothetical protein BaRGS_00024216 [Batillaria attramentaria]|uniref:Pyroglutamyl-peptidase I n=1 Tax=Batillaria attramentaria TaxID=370345 RepID=A0ABD0KBS7_9CAEN